jgi:hypothetical protein
MKILPTAQEMLENTFRKNRDVAGDIAAALSASVERNLQLQLRIALKMKMGAPEDFPVDDIVIDPNDIHVVPKIDATCYYYKGWFLISFGRREFISDVDPNTGAHRLRVRVAIKRFDGEHSHPEYFPPPQLKEVPTDEQVHEGIDPVRGSAPGQ